MSIGEKRVRVDFNQGGSELVNEIKARTAALIDLCGCSPIIGKVNAGEYARLLALAMTNYEQAAMWAVKLVTLR